MKEMSKYIGNVLVVVIFAFSGIIFTNMNNSIEINKKSILQLEKNKIDRSEISSRLDRIEGYLIAVNKQANLNDGYISKVSCDLNELKIMFKDYVLDVK